MFTVVVSAIPIIASQQVGSNQQSSDTRETDHPAIAGDSSVEHAWAMLPLEERQKFLQIWNWTHTNRHGSGRDKACTSFQRELEELREFVDGRPRLKGERAVVCGIYFGNDYVVVNSRRLRAVTSRCKSGINGCLGLLGYAPMGSNAKALEIKKWCLPGVASDELQRAWTVRSRPGAGPTSASASGEAPTPASEVRPVALDWWAPDANEPPQPQPLACGEFEWAREEDFWGGNAAPLSESEWWAADTPFE